jgi:predicted O-linked N-acetylglucosamine transferase (SPINDLY family)
VLRLPNGYAAYEPPAGAPEPGPPPVLALGHVTFGCFNNPAKLSPPALAAFADVLRRVPRSRLVLQYRGLDDPAVSGRLCEHFAAAGVARGRVELRGATRHAEYLAAYQGVDIALDPFPFAGGVTTCDSLWMGVPVVTQPGETFASRHGLSHLGGVRLTELVATDAEGYAALAATLAHDLDRLASLRTGLRDQVARSPLCDGARLGDELLTVLRCAWREWAIDSPTESSARGCG